MTAWVRRRARGALVVVELDDGAVVVAEMPRPREVAVSVAYPDDDDPFMWEPFRTRPRYHELSVHLDGSPMGTYTFIAREGVADWFARRNAEAWPDQAALDAAPPALGDGS